MMLGNHDIGKMNSSGLLLLSFCVENDLMVTNTLFRQANKYKTTWMHPRFKQWHLLDYKICYRQDTHDVRITRAMWGAECWTDHILVRTVVLLHIPLRLHKRPKFIQSSFNTEKLRHIWYCEQFTASLDGRVTSDGLMTGNTIQKWD